MMRKLLPSTIKRREEARKNREAVRRWMEEGMSRLNAFRCKTPQDPYSDERDYSMIGEGDGR
jgi:hypothetical protein